ncbi:hypothetical protein BHE74_00051187 [Ensete ventricosum]|uniref:histidine kinase n=1 Tax=Ensete ventricosum TaxID=4639 RepID=A0A445MCT5_ENSVE|nr:hypothetical protein BHE74_00051187 [Ensete ventricosum]RZR72033.1 hypothetical protein BHM03_00009787 [Ensete ventricosum]
MRCIAGMLQMLMDTDLDITQEDYVRTARASGKALVSLINEVLDQAKIESGKLELEAVPFDLRAVLDDILSLFYGKAQEKGLEFTERGHIYLTVHLIEEMSSPDVVTEAHSTNTLSGFPVADKRCSCESFKILNQGLSASDPSLLPTSSDLINLIISVEDTGLGIPIEAQSRVFTPFMQVRPSVSRIHGGTGIGLSISKCLVGLMKGEIGFVSKPQIGSTFSFTVVLTRAYAISNDYKSSEFHGMAALVVDHRPERAKVTKYHLNRLGIYAILEIDPNKVLPRLTSGTLTTNMVVIEKETWSNNASIWPSIISKLKGDQLDIPKLLLLVGPASSAKIMSVGSMEYISTIISKPLRGSMLQLSLRRAMGCGDGEHAQDERLPRLSLNLLLHEKQILVVDDNIVNLRVAAGALKRYGAEVTCAESGKEAIKMLKPPHKFDACFMDIQMPEMDGYASLLAL